MKNILKCILLLLPILLIWSCEEEMDKVTVDSISAPILLEAGDSMIDLNPNYKNNPALTLVWSHADYGVTTIKNYSILFSLTESFEEAIEVASTNKRTYTWTVDDLNMAVQSLGMTPNQNGNLFVRIVSSLGAKNQLESMSNVIKFQMTPYVTYSFNDFYLVGEALDINNDGQLSGDDWNNNSKNHILFRNAENENLYTFTGKFGGGKYFKFIKTKGEWAPQWGGTDGVIYPRANDSDPEAFLSPDNEGYYTFTVNMDAMTYSFDAFSGDTTQTYNTIGLIGDATANGWDSDTDMVQNQYDPHQWQLENVELGNGELKFRANDAWDTSWGGLTSYSGVSTLNGPNIPVTSGTYNVYFNDLTGDYQLIPIEK